MILPKLKIKNNWPSNIGEDSQSFYNSVKIQLTKKDKIQKGQNAKVRNTKRQNMNRQITNAEKKFKRHYKYDKVQKKKLHI